MTVNVLAIVYGVIGVTNIALWASPIFGDFGTDGRLFWNPFINSFFTPFGQTLDWLPAWPLFETVVGTLLVFGTLYYVISVRGTVHDVESDAATGESMIG